MESPGIVNRVLFDVRLTHNQLPSVMQRDRSAPLSVAAARVGRLDSALVESPYNVGNARVHPDPPPPGLAGVRQVRRHRH